MGVDSITGGACVVGGGDEGGHGVGGSSGVGSGIAQLSIDSNRQITNMAKTPNLFMRRISVFLT